MGYTASIGFAWVVAAALLRRGKMSAVGKIRDQRKIEFVRDDKGGMKFSCGENAAVSTAESLIWFLQTAELLSAQVNVTPASCGLWRS